MSSLDWEGELVKPDSSDDDSDEEKNASKAPSRPPAPGPRPAGPSSGSASGSVRPSSGSGASRASHSGPPSQHASANHTGRSSQAPDRPKDPRVALRLQNSSLPSSFGSSSHYSPRNGAGSATQEADKRQRSEMGRGRRGRGEIGGGRDRWGRAGQEPRDERDRGAAGDRQAPPRSEDSRGGRGGGPQLQRERGDAGSAGGGGGGEAAPPPPKPMPPLSLPESELVWLETCFKLPVGSRFGPKGRVGLQKLWPPPGTELPFKTTLHYGDPGMSKSFRYHRLVSWGGKHSDWKDPSDPYKLDFSQRARLIQSQQRLKGCTIAAIKGPEIKCAVYAVFDAWGYEGGESALGDGVSKALGLFPTCGVWLCNNLLSRAERDNIHRTPPWTFFFPFSRPPLKPQEPPSAASYRRGMASPRVPSPFTEPLWEDRFGGEGYVDLRRCLVELDQEQERVLREHETRRPAFLGLLVEGKQLIGLPEALADKRRRDKHKGRSKDKDKDKDKEAAHDTTGQRRKDKANAKDDKGPDKKTIRLEAVRAYQHRQQHQPQPSTEGGAVVPLAQPVMDQQPTPTRPEPAAEPEPEPAAEPEAEGGVSSVLDDDMDTSSDPDEALAPMAMVPLPVPPPLPRGSDRPSPTVLPTSPGMNIVVTQLALAVAGFRHQATLSTVGAMSGVPPPSASSSARPPLPSWVPPTALALQPPPLLQPVLPTTAPQAPLKRPLPSSLTEAQGGGGSAASAPSSKKARARSSSPPVAALPQASAASKSASPRSSRTRSRDRARQRSPPKKRSASRSSSSSSSRSPDKPGRAMREGRARERSREREGERGRGRGRDRRGLKPLPDSPPRRPHDRREWDSGGRRGGFSNYKGGGRDVGPPAPYSRTDHFDGSKYRPQERPSEERHSSTRSGSHDSRHHSRSSSHSHSRSNDRQSSSKAPPNDKPAADKRDKPTRDKPKERPSKWDLLPSPIPPIDTPTGGQANPLRSPPPPVAPVPVPVPVPMFVSVPRPVAAPSGGLGGGLTIAVRTTPEQLAVPSPPTDKGPDPASLGEGIGGGQRLGVVRRPVGAWVTQTDPTPSQADTAQPQPQPQPPTPTSDTRQAQEEASASEESSEDEEELSEDMLAQIDAVANMVTSVVGDQTAKP